MGQLLNSYVLITLCALIVGLFVSSYVFDAMKRIIIRDEDVQDDFPKSALNVSDLEKNKYKIYKVLICILNLFFWLVTYNRYGMTWENMLYIVAVSAMLALAAVDIAVYEIPVEMNVLILVCGIINLVIKPQNWLEYVIGLVSVSGLFLLINLFTQGRGMGGGDIKLMATLGLLLGWKKILLVMMIGSLAGAIIHGIIMLVLKKKSYLAFGPYLVAAGFVSLCYGDYIIDWYVNNFIKLNY